MTVVKKNFDTTHTIKIMIEAYLDCNNSFKFGDHLAATKSPLCNTMMNTFMYLDLQLGPKNYGVSLGIGLLW
jgi:hypothetical protein